MESDKPEDVVARSGCPKYGSDANASRSGRTILKHQDGLTKLAGNIKNVVGQSRTSCQDVLGFVDQIQ